MINLHARGELISDGILSRRIYDTQDQAAEIKEQARQETTGRAKMRRSI